MLLPSLDSWAHARPLGVLAPCVLSPSIARRDAHYLGPSTWPNRIVEEQLCPVIAPTCSTTAKTHPRGASGSARTDGRRPSLGSRDVGVSSGFMASCVIIVLQVAHFGERLSLDVSCSLLGELEAVCGYPRLVISGEMKDLGLSCAGDGDGDGDDGSSHSLVRS